MTSTTRACRLTREFIYIAAITAVNPIVTKYVSERTHAYRSSGRDEAEGLLEKHGLPALSAFGVGCTAGVLSAPCQTMNALMKSEKHRGALSVVLCAPKGLCTQS